MDLGLEGKVCAVTGASSGIGLEVTRMLCSQGAKVVMVARDPARLEMAATDCGRLGGGTAVLSLDVTGPGAGEHMVAAAKQDFGRLDVLVNNAGVARRRHLDEVPDEDYRSQFELNVMAPLQAMRAAIPGMVERGWGRVVNVASSSAKRPSANMPDYSVAKAAMLSLSRLFADEYASSGVLVNAVCPGPTSSEMWMAPEGLLDQAQRASGAPNREEALEAIGSGRPIGRLATPEEIASAIVFLSSERASYVSGAAWSVDGGSVPGIL